MVRDRVSILTRPRGDAMLPSRGRGPPRPHDACDEVAWVRSGNGHNRSPMSVSIRSGHAFGLLLAAAGVVMLPDPGSAQAASPPRATTAQRPVSIDDLLGMGVVTTPAISPDGRSVAWVVTHADREK